MLKLFRNRAGLVLAGFIAALCPLFMAPSGGFPSRPLFQAVGIGAAVPATGIINAATDVQINGTSISGGAGAANIALLNASNAFTANQTVPSISVTNTTGAQNFSQVVIGASNSSVGGYLTFNNAAVQKGVIVNERTGGANCAGSSVDDFCVRSVSGRLYGVDSAAAGQLAIIVSGSYTGTFNADCTTSPTVTIHYERVGTLVTLEIPTQSCTSNVTSFTISGAPAAISPTTSCGYLFPVDIMEDNGAGVAAMGCMSSSGQLTFSKVTAGFGLNNWTASGTKGVGDTTRGVVVHYSLD